MKIPDPHTVTARPRAGDVNDTVVQKNSIVPPDDEYYTLDLKRGDADMDVTQNTQDLANDSDDMFTTDDERLEGESFYQATVVATDDDFADSGEDSTESIVGSPLHPGIDAGTE